MLVAIFFVIASAATAMDTKIAVASTDPGKSSVISAKASRAEYFLLFDKSGTFIKAIQNPSVEAGGGAGSDTADLLNKEGVTVFIAGKFGSKLVNGLNLRKIEYMEKEGVADEVVTSYIQSH